MVKNQNCIIWIHCVLWFYCAYVLHGFMAYIKTDDIHKDIAEDVETKFYNFKI